LATARTAVVKPEVPPGEAAVAHDAPCAHRDGRFIDRRMRPSTATLGRRRHGSSGAPPAPGSRAVEVKAIAELATDRTVSARPRRRHERWSACASAGSQSNRALRVRLRGGRRAVRGRARRAPRSAASNGFDNLGCLRWCGFVVTRRAQRSVIYRIADGRVGELVALADRLLGDNAEHVACDQMIDLPGDGSGRR
jgi:hypothetical protein